MFHKEHILWLIILELQVIYSIMDPWSVQCNYSMCIVPCIVYMVYCTVQYSTVQSIQANTLNFVVK